MDWAALDVHLEDKIPVNLAVSIGLSHVFISHMIRAM